MGSVVDIEDKFVSRAGSKLFHALKHFNVDARGLICADFGCSTGGFTDCLLKFGAQKVYAIDTAKGELEWGLRNNPKVVVLEKSNILYISLPELMDLIVIDVGWTKQVKSIPVALKNLKPKGTIISLLKPQYEARKDQIMKGKVKESELMNVINNTRSEIEQLIEDKGVIKDIIQSPILGDKAGNIEYLMLIETY